MSNCLMQVNQCAFPNCAQQFANQYDLTAHIEYTHIPVIEEDVKRKKIMAANSDQPMQTSMNLPLSYYSRVFRTAYRPNNIKPEPLKISFNHYKRRATKEKIQPNQFAARILREMMARQGRQMSVEESEKRSLEIDFDECGPEDPEVRYQCAIVDCNKRYKSMFALRVHMKISHNVVVSEEAKSLTNYPSEDVKPNLSVLQQSMQQLNSDRQASSGTPTSLPPSSSSTPLSHGSPHPTSGPNFGNPATNPTSFKCSCCSKRYKTPAGLSNHMMSSHQKISEVQDVPSQMVVEQLISQVRMQRHQQEQNNSNETSSQKNLPPTQTHSQTVANILKSAGHSRTFSISSTQQPLRFSQQHYPVNLDNQPSTGQVLQMQMQHQKRLKQIQEMKQIQEQQAAQVPVATQQHSQHGMLMQQGPHVSSQVGQLGQNVVTSATQHQQHQMGQMQQSQNTEHNKHQQQPQQSQQLGQIQQLHQYHQLPSQQSQSQQQQSQQQSQYPQQIAQHSPHSYQQYHQPSPQFSQYQQASPSAQQHQQQTNGPLSSSSQPQRSPVPLSQSLPPLSSMTQQHRPSLQQLAPPNSGPMQFSPPNPQSFNTMSTPPNSQQTSSQQPPLYNH